MSISNFFASLGAPLVNQRWSWGSQRASDGVVFLRVWQDLKFMENSDAFYMVDARSNDDTHSAGYTERVRHLDCVRAGARCLLVMCTAKDVEAAPRTIDGFNESEVFTGVALRDTPADFVFPSGTADHVRHYARDGATWVRRDQRLPIEAVTG